jgi:hypothetical protein
MSLMEMKSVAAIMLVIFASLAAKIRESHVANTTSLALANSINFDLKEALTPDRH